MGGFSNSRINPVLAEVSWVNNITNKKNNKHYFSQVLKTNPEKDSGWHSLSPLPPSMHTKIFSPFSSYLFLHTYKIVAGEYDCNGDPISGNDSHTAVVHNNKVPSFNSLLSYSLSDQIDIHVWRTRFV